MKELVEKISNPRKRYVIITTNGIKNIVDEKYYNAILKSVYSGFFFFTSNIIEREEYNYD